METKVITNKWFECKIKYTKMMEDGMNKSVTELVVLPADDFGAAYEKCLTYISEYCMEDAEVTDMKIAKYSEIVSEKYKSCDTYYNVNVEFITINERTQKEKKSPRCFLVQSDTVESSKSIIDNYLSSSMVDYNVCAVSKTKIQTVLYV